MEAVALVASSLPEAQRRAAFNIMLMQVVQPIQQALQQQQPQEANGSAAASSQAVADRVLPLFDRLTVVFRCADSLISDTCLLLTTAIASDKS